MENKLLCPFCQEDIQDFVNKATASRAGKANTHEHMKEISKLANKKRWDAYRKKKAENKA